MSVVSLLKPLLEENLSLQQQCQLLEKINLYALDGEHLFQAVEYIYTLTHVPQKTHDALDIVGTGGDQQGLFNISTTCSFVIAGMGIPVLKHGNIKMSSQSGSIDCLNKLSIKYPQTLSAAKEQFNQIQLSFLLASHFYSIFSKVRDARKKLAEKNTYSIFNLLGPLLNPLRPTHQLIGVSKKEFLIPMSEALFLLKRKALVFCCQHTDELIPGEDMHIMSVDQKGYKKTHFDYTKQAIAPIHISALKGGTPDDNAQILLNILQNKTTGALSNVILFNAAFADMLYSSETSFDASYLKAQNSLQFGNALKKFYEVRNYDS